MVVTEPKLEGKEMQPSGEPPLDGLPDDAAGRGLGPRSSAGGPSPSTGTAGAHSCRPCSCGGPGRPVGRAGGRGRRVPGRRGGAQLGHIWPERRGTKRNRRPPFIPRGEGRPSLHLAKGRPGNPGNPSSTVVRDSGNWVESGGGRGGIWCRCLLAGASRTHLWLRWLSASWILVTAAREPALRSPRRRPGNLAGPSPWGGSQASRGEVTARK